MKALVPWKCGRPIMVSLVPQTTYWTTLSIGFGGMSDAPVKEYVFSAVLVNSMVTTPEFGVLPVPHQLFTPHGVEPTT